MCSGGCARPAALSVVPLRAGSGCCGTGHLCSMSVDCTAGLCAFLDVQCSPGFMSFCTTPPAGTGLHSADRQQPVCRQRLSRQAEKQGTGPSRPPSSTGRGRPGMGRSGPGRSAGGRSSSAGRGSGIHGPSSSHGRPAFGAAGRGRQGQGASAGPGRRGPGSSAGRGRDAHRQGSGPGRPQSGSRGRARLSSGPGQWQPAAARVSSRPALRQPPAAQRPEVGRARWAGADQGHGSGLRGQNPTAAAAAGGAAGREPSRAGQRHYPGPERPAARATGRASLRGRSLTSLKKGPLPSLRGSRGSRPRRYST